MKRINLSSIIDKQPIQNIGFVGHVAHGKSTTVYDLTGIRTQKSSKELERNCTINLGYANLKIYRDIVSNKLTIFSNDQTVDPTKYVLYKHCSIVDCPGHQSYMATMMSGTETIDIALVLIAANEPIPQQQTSSHLNVLIHTNIQHICTLFNKIDLLAPLDEASQTQRLTELDNFIKSKPISTKPLIPISASEKINMSQVIDFIASVPNTDICVNINKPFKMNILRSFNINKPDVTISDFVGGVIGGSISSGYVSVGDWLMIKPGIIVSDTTSGSNKWTYNPIFTQIISIKTDMTNLEMAFPGGLIALGLDCDPALCRNNDLLGNRVYKLDQTNMEEIIRTKNVCTEFEIKLTYLTDDPMTYLTSNRIILLINSSPIDCIISKYNSDKTILSVNSSRPIVVDQSTISVMGKLNQQSPVELFAYGHIIKVLKNSKCVLPSEINNLFDQLQVYQPIEIIDDVSKTTVIYESNIQPLTDIEILKKQIKQLNMKVVTVGNFKMSIPKLEFIIEQTRYIWSNAQTIIDKFDLNANSKLTVRIDDSKIKWKSFGEILIDYLNYIYKKEEGGDTNGASIDTAQRMIIHVKRNTKKKPKDVIIEFINTYFACPSCQSITARIGKIQTQTMSICVLCNHRTKLPNW